jgi:hypothetical protein
VQLITERTEAMTMEWEHEVRLYPHDDPDHSLDRMLAAAAYDETAVIAACTCGKWVRPYAASLAARTAWDEIAKHEAWHASLRPPLDPAIIAEVARAIIERGGAIAAAECRYCHVALMASGPLPDWAAVGGARAYPALWCPDTPTRGGRQVIPLHVPIEVPELVAKAAK